MISKSQEGGGKVTGAETPTTEITDSLGGNTTASSSADRVGAGFEVGAIALAGGEIGATKAGWSALGDAVANVKNEISPPSPPAPTMPAPPLTPRRPTGQNGRTEQTCTEHNGAGC